MNYTKKEIIEIISQRENSAVKFKDDAVRPESLTKEIVSFANTTGGTILIGVDDNGEISGTSKQEEWVMNIARNNLNPAISCEATDFLIKDRRILVVDIPKGKNKPYQTLDGKFYIRVGSTNRQATKEELSRLFQQAGLIQFDKAPLNKTGLKNLDLRKINEYYKNNYDLDFFELSDFEQRKILLNSDILVHYEKEIVCSVGGLLVFGKNPQRFIPAASIVFSVFDGSEFVSELLDKKEIAGTLDEQIDNAVAKIKLMIPTPSQIEDNRRKEYKRIPAKVLREAIVNAVCHRDYSITNRKIHVNIFKNRIQINSPGKLPNTLDLDKIKYGNSAPRNLFILKYLDNMRYIDGLGRGIPTILNLIGEKNCCFEEIGDVFKLTIYFDV